MNESPYVERTVECRLHDATLVDAPRVIHMTSSPPAVIRIHDEIAGLVSVYVLSCYTHGIAEYLFDRLD